MSKDVSTSNQQSPNSYATKTASAKHEHLFKKAEAASLPTKTTKSQRVTKPTNQRQVYVPRACKSCKAAHMGKLLDALRIILFYPFLTFWIYNQLAMLTDPAFAVNVWEREIHVLMQTEKSEEDDQCRKKITL